LKGCRTIGIAGGREKVAQCLEEFGYDAAIDYKGVADLDGAIKAACPDGVDVYYDNTSGPISDAVLRNLKLAHVLSSAERQATRVGNPWNSGPRPSGICWSASQDARDF